MLPFKNLVPNVIPEQTITVTVTKQKSWFAALGYKDLKQGAKICVPVSHLQNQSNKMVLAVCDKCKTEFTRQYQLLMKAKEHLCYSCARRSVGEKHKVNKKQLAHLKQLSECKRGESHHRWNPNKSSFAKYRYAVQQATKKQQIETLVHFDKMRSRCGVDGAYQLDHIISIKSGFDNGVSPEIIGSIFNLRFLPWEVNLAKHSAQHMTFGELFMMLESTPTK